MAIGEPIVHVECDKCGEVTDPISLTALAQKSWDMRNVPGALKRMGWRVDGEQTFCEECSDETVSS